MDKKIDSVINSTTSTNIINSITSTNIIKKETTNNINIKINNKRKIWSDAYPIIYKYKKKL